MKNAFVSFNKFKAIIVSAIIGAGAAAPAIAAPVYVQAEGEWGVLLVNQVNGNINYCVGLQNSNGTPIGKCARIGAISSASLSGNVQISIPGTNYSVALITNTATGAVVECSLVYAATGVPTGTCLAQQVQ